MALNTHSCKTTVCHVICPSELHATLFASSPHVGKHATRCDCSISRKVKKMSPAHSLYQELWETKIFLQGAEVADFLLQIPSTSSSGGHVMLAYTMIQNYEGGSCMTPDA